MFFSRTSLVYNQDIANSPQTDATSTHLTIRTQYQAAVAELGFQALSGVDLNTLFNDAILLITRTLNVQYVSLLELLSNGKFLTVVAGMDQYTSSGKIIVDIANNE